MPTKITYDVESCHRCAGSGHYSFCTMYGTVCYGCNGSTKQLTKPAKKSRVLFEAKKKALCEIPVTELHTGDRFLYSGKYILVTEEPERLETPRFDSISKHLDGSETRRPQIRLTLKNSGTAFPFISYQTSVDSLVIKKPNAEQFAELCAYAQTLKGMKVIRTEAPKE